MQTYGNRLMRRIGIRALAGAGLGGVLALAIAAQLPASAEQNAGAAFDTPGTSSPIALDANKNLLWVVNPDDDKVTVIGNLDATPSVLAQVSVGDEPQSVAIDTDASPNSYNVYVANARGNSVTVISVDNSSAGSVTINPAKKTLVTGAEPWNIVASPDGTRVFVANSVQDTITVIRTDNQTVVGAVDLKNSACNDPDRARHFQPRGLAVTLDNTRLYVTRFLSFAKTGGTQADDLGKDGVVCQLSIPGVVTTLPSVVGPIALASQNTGFKIDKNKDTIPDDTFAYPNQMQSIVIRGNQAYVPNIASSPSGPLRFNVDTHSYINVIDNAATGTPADAGATKFVNMHLGARVPEAGKRKLFFANPWAVAFTNQSGAGNAYAVSSGSDALIKLNVDAAGALAFTGGVSTTRYIDLNDPAVAATSGANAGKNPLGIVIRGAGAAARAYVMNYISRNVSVVDLSTDTVVQVLKTTDLPIPGSQDEQLHVGAEIFFSSRGNFVRPAGTTVSTEDRLSSEGWQNCASCHFNGWTDGNVWAFGAGPRKSVPLAGTWSPHNPDDQRVLNYSAIFDEVQDFELNIRNVSGPGNLSAGPPPVLDPNHGLIISDTGDINAAPGVVNAFLRANAGRPQHKVKLPGSSTEWPALDAVTEWVRFAVRTPNGMLNSDELPAANGGLPIADVRAGRKLFFQAGCQQCHGGSKWTRSEKDFTSPPGAAEIATEAPVTTTVGTQFLHRFLSDVGSFGLGTGTNPIGNNVGGAEKDANGLDAIGRDANGDGKGVGYNIPSLLGIWHVPPYYHNGACESLACVLGNATHRAKGLKSGQTDPLATQANRDKLELWLRTLDAETEFPVDLRMNKHDIHVEPTTLIRGEAATVNANVQLFGSKPDLTDLLADTGISAIKVRFQFDVGTPTSVDVNLTPAQFNQSFGQAVVSTTWTAPASGDRVNVTITVDPDGQVFESKESNNSASRKFKLRAAPADRTAPTISGVFISDETVFSDTDLIAATSNVKIKIVATDPASPPQQTSGVKDFCVVTYSYDVVNRRWRESECAFAPLPAPTATDTFIVNSSLQAAKGVAYAFVWVRDGAGNVSRQPGFDVITFLNADPIALSRNDVSVLRLPLAAGQNLQLTIAPSFGDVDVSVFDDFGNASANRIALSANNGTAPETVTLTGPGRFQVEIRAAVNSQFAVTVAPAAAATQSQPADVQAVESGAPLVAGPPVRAAAADEGDGGSGVYLPVLGK
jgi:DNA-binding beta-propeller fold protein YncE